MVEFIDTTLRDAHQSLLATRFKTEDMIRIAELLDKVGFYSLEVWGGATFDVAIRFLNEDPWVRLKILKEHVRKTKLQMLLRGQNLVGYRNYPDDVVEKFVEYAYRNGIDVFRIFDALNDIRNLKTSIKTAKKIGAIVQGAICYTVSPVHTIEYYVGLAEELLSLDVDMITIKDMAGILDPFTAYELVSRLKKELKTKVNIHSHSTSGLVIATYMKAVEAGVDIIDTSISPLAFGTSQPDCRTVYYVLEESKRPDVDLKIINKISSILRFIIERKYKHLLRWNALISDPSVLIHQVPGGMYSNLIEQLKEQNALDKLDQVLREIPVVRKELGYPPLVTPLSQIVGTQAVLNVLFGRYRVIARETKDYVKGLYGKPPAPISEKLVRKILGDEKPIAVRPADLLQPMYEKCREELIKLGYYEKEEDVLTYCLFPQTALIFFKKRKGEVKEPRIERKYGFTIKIVMDKQEYVVDPSELSSEIINVLLEKKRSSKEEEIKKEEIERRISGLEIVESPIAGRILRILVKPGDTVNIGDKLIVLESMKMETYITSPFKGVVKEVFVHEGEYVSISSKLLSILTSEDRD